MRPSSAAPRRPLTAGGDAQASSPIRRSSAESRRPGSASTATQRSASATRSDRSLRHRNLLDASAILSPPKEMPRRIPRGRGACRPNTAGLTDHLRLWDLEKLQSLVTRNGLGSATWRSTMLAIQRFRYSHPTIVAAAAAEEDPDDDEDECVDAAIGRRKMLGDLQIGGGGSTSATPGMSKPTTPLEMPVSKLPPSRFSYSPLPRDAIVLRVLKGAQAVANMLRTSPEFAGKRLSTCCAELRQLFDADVQRSEARGSGVTVKVVSRQLFLDKATQLFGKSASNSDYATIFRELAAGDSVVVAAVAYAALDFAAAPSARLAVRLVLLTVSLLRASLHCSELHAAEAVVRSSKCVSSAQALQPPSSTTPVRGPVLRSASSMSLKQDLSQRDEHAVIDEFVQLCRFLLQPRRPAGSPSNAAAGHQSGAEAPGSSRGAGGPSTPLAIVESVTWNDLRAAVYSGPFPILLDILSDVTSQ